MIILLLLINLVEYRFNPEQNHTNIIDILKDTKYFEHTKPYIVHRLDKETSGVMIIAKNREYAQLFTSLFRIRKIHKTYLAVCFGRVTKN